MANNVSTLGQQMNIISRIKDMQSQMSTYQQQISTGVKYQDFKSYGIDSLRIQNYRADLSSISTYMYNIDSSQTNIQQMNSSLSESMEQAGNILDAISVQLSKGSEFDLENIKGAAATALKMVETSMNTRVGDRYLFAGSDVSNEPYPDASTGTSNIQSRVTDWLNGTSDTATFLSDISGLTDSQSGYSNSLQSAKNVTARASDDMEVDYTVKANSEGFKKVLNGLRAIANMEFPTDTDVPTKDNFYEALDGLYQMVQDGINGLRSDSTKVATAAQVLDSIKTNHTDDRQNLQTIMESTEAADTTDAVIKFQTLQTQLNASFQVTSILSQLSLARLLGS